MYIFRESEFSRVLHLSIRSICIFRQLPPDVSRFLATGASYQLTTASCLHTQFWFSTFRCCHCLRRCLCRCLHRCRCRRRRRCHRSCFLRRRCGYCSRSPDCRRCISPPLPLPPLPPPSPPSPPPPPSPPSPPPLPPLLLRSAAAAVSAAAVPNRRSPDSRRCVSA
jgi:hypothetical protein